MSNQPEPSRETREISLKLEQYDDIFSDFDIRPYSERSLSVDFLDEIKRAARDKDDNEIELALFVPTAEKGDLHEGVIRERLATHFQRHHQLLMKEKRKVLRLGIGMVVLGIICMIVATRIVFEDPTQNMLLSFLVVFLEPAAWFLLWEGMDQVIFNSKNINPELNFYKKMSASSGNIQFRTY